MSEKLPDNVSGLDAELQRLQGEAAAADAGVNPVTQEAAQQEAEGQVAQVQASEIEELAGILFVVASLTFPMFPSLVEIYTMERCYALAACIVPVMVKRGWSVQKITNGWGEEIALAVIAAPLGWATYQAVKADMKAAEIAAKLKEKREPQEVVVVEPERQAQADNEPQLAERG